MIQYITAFFTRPEKSLLGVCSALSGKFNQRPVVIRIAFIVLAFLFAALAVILYIGLYLAICQKQSKMMTLGLLGALLGIPLSYYFQSDVVKYLGGQSGVLSYLRNFASIVDEYDRYIGDGSTIILNVVMSVAIFGAVGGVVGYVLGTRRG